MLKFSCNWPDMQHHTIVGYSNEHQSIEILDTGYYLYFVCVHVPSVDCKSMLSFCWVTNSEWNLFLSLAAECNRIWIPQNEHQRHDQTWHIDERDGHNNTTHLNQYVGRLDIWFKTFSRMGNHTITRKPDIVNKYSFDSVNGSSDYYTDFESNNNHYPE